MLTYNEYIICKMQLICSTICQEEMGMFKRARSIAAGAIAGTIFIAGLSAFPADNGTQNFEVNAAKGYTEFELLYGQRGLPARLLFLSR